MTHAKSLFAVILAAHLIAPLALGQSEQEAKQSSQRPIDLLSENRSVRVVKLRFIDSDSVVRSVLALTNRVRATTADGNSLLLVGEEGDLKTILDDVISKIDVPPESAGVPPGKTVAFLRLSREPTRDLMSMVRTVMVDRGSRVALDKAGGTLVVYAEPSEIEAVKRVLAEVDRPKRPLTLQFFFIRASIGHCPTGETGELPHALSSVAATLKQNGFSELSLMAPLTVRVDDGDPFESTSGLNTFAEETGSQETLTVHVKGSARLQSKDSSVQLSLDTTVSGKYLNATGGNGDVVFEVETTVAAKLSQYVILAASPTSTAHGDAVALVVRVLAD